MEASVRFIILTLGAEELLGQVCFGFSGQGCGSLWTCTHTFLNILLMHALLRWLRECLFPFILSVQPLNIEVEI